jgi:transcriptional regulator with AAA-type ATPase domain
LLQKLISADPKLLPNGREVCWVFYLDSTRYPQLLPESSPEMFNLVKRHLITLPPLRERLADLASYLKLHLDLFASREENPGRAQLSPEAVAELLDYAWPGNYAQVMDTARAIAATERTGPLSREDAVTILGQESVSAGANLEGYLRSRQREYLEDAARRAGVAPTVMLKNLKLDFATPPKSDDLGNLGLLYPDLLSGV